MPDNLHLRAPENISGYPPGYRIPRSSGKSYDAFLLATNTESLEKVSTNCEKILMFEQD